jgi:hypothetical protein
MNFTEKQIDELGKEKLEWEADQDILNATLLLAMRKDAPSKLEHVQTIKKLGAANAGILVKNK